MSKGHRKSHRWLTSDKVPGTSVAMKADIQGKEHKAAASARRRGGALTAKQIENDKRPDKLLRRFSWEDPE